MERVEIEYLELIRQIRSLLEQKTSAKKTVLKREINSSLPQVSSSTSLPSPTSFSTTLPPQALPPKPTLSLPAQALPQIMPLTPSQAITITKKEEKKVGLFSLTQFGVPTPLDISLVQKALPSFKKAPFFCPIVICYLQEKQKEFATKLAYALTLQKRFATSHHVDVSELAGQIKKEWPFVLTFSHSSLLSYLPEKFHYHSFYPRKNGHLFLFRPIEEYEQNSNSKRNLWTILLAQLPQSLST